MSALLKYKPDDDDERETYSAPDGSANHATKVVTSMTDLGALIEI